MGRPTLPCQLLRNVRFGVNFKKKCKITAAELLNAQIEFLTPYLIFREDNKSFIHALPVIVKSADQVTLCALHFNNTSICNYYNNQRFYISLQNIKEILRQQLVRKFFLVDNVSGFKAVPIFMNSRFTKASELSVLRYMKSLTIL